MRLEKRSRANVHPIKSEGGGGCRKRETATRRAKGAIKYPVNVKSDRKMQQLPRLSRGASLVPFLFCFSFCIRFNPLPPLFGSGTEALD